MFTCPYCGKPGISPLSKLVAAGASFWGWSMVCRSCRQPSRISGTATNIQFAILLLAGASIPWLLAGEARLAAAYVAGAAILAVGFFAPLKKDLTA